MTLTKIAVAGVEFDSCVMNASGPRDTTLEELEIIAQSESAAIMMKSCTIEPQPGNNEPRYRRLAFGSYQSIGLANFGYLKYKEFALQLKKYDKPIIASVAGLCVTEYLQLVESFQNSSVDLIEVNLSCPNFGSSVLGYDLRQAEEILKAVSGLGKKPLGVKLPPYYEVEHQKQIAELIQRHNISVVTCINSIGNTLVIDPESETSVISSRRGGLSGQQIKPIALGNVRTFYEIFEDEISIFGVGGIVSGADAFEFILAGASAVQVATTFEKEGPSSFSRINRELEQILNRKQYTSVQEVKGKLKYL